MLGTQITNDGWRMYLNIAPELPEIKSGHDYINPYMYIVIHTHTQNFEELWSLS